MAPIKNVLVVGARGNLGPVVIQHLLSADFAVTVLSRDDTAIPNIKVLKTDYSDASILEACKGQDAIVSTMGALATMTQTKIIDAAIASGVKRFIPSDFGLNTPEMSPIEKHLPALHQRLKPKKLILDYLNDKSSQNPGFTWTAIGAAPLFDWTLKAGFLGTSILNYTATIIDSGNEPYITTTIPQIARAIVSVLQKPVETANIYLLVTSFKTTQNQVLRAAEIATGQKFEVKQVEAEAWKTEGTALLQKGDFRGFGRFWGWFLWKDGEGHGAPSDGIVVGNELLGLPQEHMEVVIRGIAGL
ncbi:Isoflavone reductase-like protein P3 [Lachnellula suecica]|uniref:Isoflavone reductase-like protein P3 n=1 Tax=Lachnellula suecica TaxID=602035 RepID=A0A8T9CNE7_9HELO|nr:Isoflavone reductase-like protein P3 [Lachnellula suecica]